MLLLDFGLLLDLVASFIIHLAFLFFYPLVSSFSIALHAYDPYDHTAEFDPKDISDNKVFAMICYLMGFIGIIVALLATNSSKYAMFHVRQALKIEVASILSIFVLIIPFLGWIAFPILQGIIWVIKIISFFQICSGKAKEPAIIRSFGFLR